MKTRKTKKISQREMLKGIRKPMPPPTKVINPRKDYDRRDKSWMDDIDPMEDGNE